jgi:hypothetical protein
VSDRQLTSDPDAQIKRIVASARHRWYYEERLRAFPEVNAYLDALA